MAMPILLALTLLGGGAGPVVDQAAVIGVVLQTGIYRSDMGVPENGTDKDFVLFPLAVAEPKELKAFYPPDEWDSGITKLTDIETKLSDRTRLVAAREFHVVGERGRSFTTSGLVRCCGSMGSSVYGYRGKWNRGATPSRPTVVSTKPTRSLLTAETIDAKGVLRLSTKAIHAMELTYRDSYASTDRGFDPAMECVPTVTRIQNIKPIRGRHVAWIEVTKPYGRKPDATCSFSALYQGLFHYERKAWAPYWDQAILLQNDGPLYEDVYGLLNVCDTNRDGVPELVFESGNCESSSLAIKELRNGTLVELARLYAVSWWN